LAEFTRPVAKVVSRKRVTRRPWKPKDFTKHQRYAMLAEAVRNAG
jgi:hypothetical protein